MTSASELCHAKCHIHVKEWQQILVVLKLIDSLMPGDCALECERYMQYGGIEEGHRLIGKLNIAVKPF